MDFGPVTLNIASPQRLKFRFLAIILPAILDTVFLGNWELDKTCVRFSQI